MELQFFVGTYIHSLDYTIYQCVVKADKKVTIKKYIGGKNPSFLTFHSSKKYCYSVNELCKSSDGVYGKIVCLSKTSDNTYEKVLEQSTEGDYPCHVALDRKEKYLLVTNYGSGSLCVYQLDDDGRLGALVQLLQFTGKSINSERQEAPHIHQTLLTPCENFICATDLGCDYIYIFELDYNSKIPLVLKEKISCPKGSGPRHMTWSDCGNYLYVSSELHSSILVFKYDELQHTLIFLQECSAFLGEENPYLRTSTSEIAYYHNKVYMANRGDDSIAIFHVTNNGMLEHIQNVACGGRHPRHFKIFSNNQWGGIGTLVIVNQNSNNITLFSIEKDTLINRASISLIPTPAVIV